MPPKVKKTVKPKRFCVKNQTTRRCVRSEEKNDTSNLCQISKNTQRCTNIKDFVPYNGFKVVKSIPSFLNKKIINPPLAKLMSIAQKDESYEDVAKFLFEKKNKTDADIKHGIVEELLDMAANAARDKDHSTVIEMKHIKYIIKDDSAFIFLRK